MWLFGCGGDAQGGHHSLRTAQRLYFPLKRLGLSEANETAFQGKLKGQQPQEVILYAGMVSQITDTKQAAG